jgi:hypothetical protein
MPPRNATGPTQRSYGPPRRADVVARMIIRNASF